jgi:hypothetical protein
MPKLWGRKWMLTLLLLAAACSVAPLPKVECKQVPEFLEKKLEQSGTRKGLRGARLNKYVFGAMNNMGAVHGNKITAKGRRMEEKHDDDTERKVKFRAQPNTGDASNEVPEIAEKPADPMFARDDIRDAAMKAWNSSASGQKESEAGFWIKGGVPNIGLQEHPYGNQRLEITDTLPPNATAEVHVHPNKGRPDPSDNDKAIADKHKIDVYTISRHGVYAYRPSRKTTEFLGPLEDFIDKGKKKKN